MRPEYTHTHTHTEKTEAKAVKTFIRLYSVIKSHEVNVNNK